MSQRLLPRRSSAARALGAALAVALAGVLPVVGGHRLSPGGERPPPPAGVVQRPVPGVGASPSGVARGGDLPGLVAAVPTGVPSADAEPSGEPGSQPGASGPVPATAPAGPSTSRVLHLTFDDGPDPTWTPRVLAVLARYGVKATFFELGVQVREHPTLPALVRRQGHRIGNHTYGHKSLPTLDDGQLRRQIDGGPSATCLRPPFGDVDARVRAAAARAGQTIVLWDVDTRDWAKLGTAHIVRAVLDNVHPGATILMHDAGGDRSETVAALRIVLWDVDTRDWAKLGTAHIVRAVLDNVHPGATILMHDAGGDRSETVAALRIVLPRLLAQGYTFTTVPGC